MEGAVHNIKFIVYVLLFIIIIIHLIYTPLFKVLTRHFTSYTMKVALRLGTGRRIEGKLKKLTFVVFRIHYRSKVWDHPDNFVSSMKNHTFIYQMNVEYSQDIDMINI